MGMDNRNYRNVKPIVLSAAYSPVVHKGPEAHTLPQSDRVGHSLNLQQRSVRVIIDIDGFPILVNSLRYLELTKVLLDNLTQFLVISILAKECCELLASAADEVTIEGCPVVVELVSLAVFSLTHLAKGY